MDALLDSFLAAAPENADAALGDLLDTHASPIARRVIVHRLGDRCRDADDVHAQVLLHLMLRLRRGRVEETLGAINTFAAYVAAAAHHGCDHYVRATHPLRWQLRNRIRYALEHERSFALWKSVNGVWLCGRQGWQTRSAVDPPAVADAPPVAATQMKAFLTQLFERVGGPLALTAVVDTAADLWGVPRFQTADVAELDQLSDRARTADAALAQRQHAAQAWLAIRELPVRQRQALLLHLADDALSVFVTTGTASIRAIAEALDLDLAAFAALWEQLPLADNAIAERLGCARQQVINLRMAARKRLNNRLRRPS